MQADNAHYAECAEYAEKFTADGAYFCPVGSIMAIFSYQCPNSSDRGLIDVDNFLLIRMSFIFSIDLQTLLPDKEAFV